MGIKHLCFKSILPILFVLAGAVGCGDPSLNTISQTEIYRFDLEYTRAKAKQAFAFITSKRMNESYCILIDMRLHSGRKRFFVWDFEEDRIMHQFLVSHGCCNNPWRGDWSKNNPTFSNIEGSHCSSLGKYKLGERGYSSWGVNVKYLLHGLEASNSNALMRDIVFHSWEAIPDEEVYPQGTPEGWGCPAISNNHFLLLYKILKDAQRPVLMWIYTD